MKLLFKQRLFSWFDSYDIYDEFGNTVYVVKGQLSWGHKLVIYDADGNEIGMVVQRDDIFPVCDQDIEHVSVFIEPQAIIFIARIMNYSNKRISFFHFIVPLTFNTLNLIIHTQGSVSASPAPCRRSHSVKKESLARMHMLSGSR